ncbi:MAG TPA: hypothetical protein VNL73_03415 [Verrucomicrobiae bacterium]|nr:hypothetical protein [Verrucomicrobiae bacterium]
MTEEQLARSMISKYLPKESRVFRKFSHNTNLDRDWNYYCGTDIDILEITKDNQVIGYELKGFRKNKGKQEPPALYEGLDQALNYLNLPYVFDVNNKMLFEGGVFDHVYLAHARQSPTFENYERRVFNVTPIGFIIATPDGQFHKVQEAKLNPIQDVHLKDHFLRNLDSVKKFSVAINSDEIENAATGSSVDKIRP